MSELSCNYNVTVQVPGFEVLPLDVINAIAAHNADGLAHPALATGAGARYEQTFTDSSLSVANLLVVDHGLGVIPNSIQVLNTVGQEIFPDAILGLTDSSVTIDLSAFRPFQGVGKVIVGG